MPAPPFAKSVTSVGARRAGRQGEDAGRMAPGTLTQAQQATRAAQRTPQGEIGRLVVGFMNAAMVGILPDMLRVFRGRFPEVELTLHELTTSPQLHALHERRLDAGFFHPPLDDDTSLWETLHREPLVVMLPQRHDLTSRERIPLRMLAREPFILPPYTRAYGAGGQVIRLCQSAGFVPQVIQEASQAVNHCGACRREIGVSVVPLSAQTLREQGVVYRAIHDQTVMRELASAWHGD